ncbi:MAG: hypothetical protein KKE00_09865, partial [Proteobacteria bacterium]|nr:hypothetical protein [Pseudomonadota bacterium]
IFFTPGSFFAVLLTFLAGNGFTAFGSFLAFFAGRTFIALDSSTVSDGEVHGDAHENRRFYIYESVI